MITHSDFSFSGEVTNSERDPRFPELRVLITADEIAEMVSELAQEISQDYKGRELSIIQIANGACVFTADLIRQLTLKDVSLQTIVVSTYGQERFSGHTDGPKICMETISDGWLHLKDRHLLIVDEVFDSGDTMEHVIKEIKAEAARREDAARKAGDSDSIHNFASLEACVFLFKKNKTNKDKKSPKYFATPVVNKWLCGYGMDGNKNGIGLFRHLPYVAVKESD